MKIRINKGNIIIKKRYKDACKSKNKDKGKNGNNNTN